MSLANNGTYTVGTLNGVHDEDILGWTGTDYVMVFDGSDVGLPSSQDINAFYIVSPNIILMSFESGMTLAGAGTVDDSDIVQFTATSLGDTTAGSFSLYFDGSDVGLTTGGEDIDAVELLPDNRLLISTLGAVAVPGLPAPIGDTSWRDEDILAFTPTSLGGNTAGSWAGYFEGSDVGLGGPGNAGEDVNGLAVDSIGDIYLTTQGNFNTGSVSGENEDIFICTPTSLGDTTSCTYSPTLFFDGSVNGINNRNVDAIDLPN